MNEENQEKKGIAEIKERVLHKAPSTQLSISRVPMDIANKFKEIANEHFAGDYGMTLKYLIDKDQKETPLKDMLWDLRTEVDALKAHVFGEAKKEVKTLSPLEGKRGKQ
jgi:methionine salvage enolase-phosphatase E1